jgi:hypothetical protein
LHHQLIAIIKNNYKNMSVKNWLSEPLNEAIEHTRAGRYSEAIERCDYAIEISGVATKSSAARLVRQWSHGTTETISELARAIALITVAKTAINAGEGINVVSAIALLDSARYAASNYF